MGQKILRTIYLILLIFALCGKKEEGKKGDGLSQPTNGIIDLSSIPILDKVLFAGNYNISIIDNVYYPILNQVSSGNLPTGSNISITKDQNTTIINLLSYSQVINNTDSSLSGQIIVNTEKETTIFSDSLTIKQSNTEIVYENFSGKMMGASWYIDNITITIKQGLFSYLLSITGAKLPQVQKGERIEFQNGKMEYRGSNVFAINFENFIYIMSGFGTGKLTIQEEGSLSLASGCFQLPKSKWKVNYEIPSSQGLPPCFAGTGKITVNEVDYGYSSDGQSLTSGNKKVNCAESANRCSL